MISDSINKLALKTLILQQRIKCLSVKKDYNFINTLTF